jgi:hypothetical protein
MTCSHTVRLTKRGITISLPDVLRLEGFCQRTLRGCWDTLGLLSSYCVELFRRKQRQGLPGCRAVSMSRMPWSPTPRKRSSPRPYGDARLTSAHFDAVVLPVCLDYGALSLQPFGLRPASRWPTLRVQHYCCHSQGLATRWLAQPSEMGFSPTRLHGIARSLQNRKPEPGLVFWAPLEH